MTASEQLHAASYAAKAPRLSASVVIPAHNEGRVIGRTLSALMTADAVDLDIVVVANGCTDDTVEVAGSFDRVRVIDEPCPGKANALNRGDLAARGFPRIFLDADITLSPTALTQLVSALDTDVPRVGSPRITFDLCGTSWPVRAFYEIFTRLPYATDGLTGLGVYGLSEAARGRFDRFPSLTADDLYVQRLFDPSERVTVEGSFSVSVPRDLANLVRVRTRVARGNAELARHREAETADERFSTTSGSTIRSIVELVRHEPRLLPPAAVYVGVSLVCRLRARLTRPRWERDVSTR